MHARPLALALALLGCGHRPHRAVVAASPVAPAAPAAEPPPSVVAAPVDHEAPRGTSTDYGDFNPNTWTPVCEEADLAAEGEAWACSEHNRRAIYQPLLDAAITEVLMTPTRTTPAPRGADWNRAITPAMRAVGEVLGMATSEWNALARNGFVVLDRQRYGSHYEAFKDIYRSELPLAVTADAILHAVFRSYSVMLADIEAPFLRDATEALAATHGALPAFASQIPAESVRDLDLYLAVARSLATDEAPAPHDRALHDEAVALATAVRRAEGISEVTVFGRTRVVDFAAYAPRGPYADEGARARWFRVARWLSRFEFNVASRDCRSSQPGITPVPDETPREALDAFALAALMDRAGTLARFASISDRWGRLAGRREDLGPFELESVRRDAAVTSLRDADAFARLRAAVGDRFPRTARTHPMPQGVRALPAIATVLGARVVADAQMTRALVHDAIEGRYSLSAADVAMALGHDGAARYLAADLARHPGLREGFRAARALLDAPREEGDLHAAWLTALRALAAPPAAGAPSFMRTRAFDDHRMNSLVVGYGQIRHAHVLLAADAYDGTACRIPDAWVEPVPDLYRRLRVFVERAEGALAPADHPRWERWGEAVTRMLRVLERVAREELAGHRLTEAQRRALGYVAEVMPSTDGAPMHTGWYVQMFPRVENVMTAAGFIADYYASVTANEVAYVGAQDVATAVYVVDRGGPPRLMVGPVVVGYEHHGPLARRLDDEAAAQLPAAERAASWRRSYAVPPGSTPRLAIDEYDQNEGGFAARYTIAAGATPGTLTMEFLSSHRRVVARGSARVGPATTLAVRWVGAAPENSDVEICAVRLRHGAWSRLVRSEMVPLGDACRFPYAGALSTVHGWDEDAP